MDSEVPCSGCKFARVVLNAAFFISCKASAEKFSVTACDTPGTENFILWPVGHTWSRFIIISPEGCAACWIEQPLNKKCCN